MEKTAPIKTGFDVLDGKIGGFRPGELAIIKCKYDYSYMAQMIKDVFYNQGKNCLLLSFMENSVDEQLILQALGTGGDVHNLSLENLRESVHGGYFNALLKGNKLFEIKHHTETEDTPRSHIEFAKFLANEVSKNKIDIIFIDDFYQFPRIGRNDIRCVEVLKTLATKLNIPIIAGCCFFHERKDMSDFEFNEEMKLKTDILLDTSKQEDDFICSASISLHRNQDTNPISIPLIFDSMSCRFHDR